MSYIEILKAEMSSYTPTCIILMDVDRVIVMDLYILDDNVHSLALFPVVVTTVVSRGTD